MLSMRMQFIWILAVLGSCSTSKTAKNNLVAAWVPSAIVGSNFRQRFMFANQRASEQILPIAPKNTRIKNALSLSSTSSSSASPVDVNVLEASVTQLKRVLEREYISFFNPMERDYYSERVTFIDPLTQLTGIDPYQNNVDMLSGRTLLGSILFRDARIILHSVTGGQIIRPNDSNGVRIENIVTRWTLRFTFKILPWAPSPSFTGVSVYCVEAGGPKNVRIVQQNDYWDAINLQPGGEYKAVVTNVALQHFLSQLLPSNFKAASAGSELPYTTLRLASDYEVRRYPAYLALQMTYDRRDEAYLAMSTYTKGMNPMVPAIMQVNTPATTENDVTTRKSMMWPLKYALPGETLGIPNTGNPALSADDDVTMIIVPESVVAIRTFGDAIVEPLVRKVDQQLRSSLTRDGLLSEPASSSTLTFAQYDAIYSMGERRSEVHVRLEDGTHPW